MSKLITSCAEPCLQKEFFAKLRRKIDLCASHNRWYKNALHHKPNIPLVKKETFANDWEHNIYQPRAPEAICSSVKDLPGFQDLDERAKSLFTYQFVPKRKEFEEQLNAKLLELGYHPTDTSTGASVVRMTMSLRFKKWTLQTEYRNRKLRYAIRALIGIRQAKLRLLRATNLPEFNRLVEALDITGYCHPDPYDLPHTEVTQRKKAVREQCYRSRLARLAVLKSELSASERSFYDQKAAKMDNILRNLASLDVVKTESDVQPNSKQLDDAKDLLQRLFQEVVLERRAEVLSAPEAEALQWYAREDIQREQYLAKEAEKTERQLRRKR